MARNHYNSSVDNINIYYLRCDPLLYSQLAERLIHSLDKEDPEAEKLWIEEAERRYRADKEGKVKTKSADLVFKEARSKFK